VVGTALNCSRVERTVLPTISLHSTKSLYKQPSKSLLAVCPLLGESSKVHDT
jgi:hypothetical protein